MSFEKIIREHHKKLLHNKTFIYRIVERKERPHKDVKDYIADQGLSDKNVVLVTIEV